MFILFRFWRSFACPRQLRLTLLVRTVLGFSYLSL